MFEPVLFEVGFVHEQHVTPAEYAAIAVVHRINGGVVLVVAAYRDEPQYVLCAEHVRVFLDAVIDREDRLSGRRGPLPLGWRQREAKSAGMPDTFVERFEARDGLLDQV